LQLLDDEHHQDGADALTSCGALYGLMAPWHDQRSSANAYHSARIVVNGALVEYWIDERQVLGCDLASEELAQRIARSRFREVARLRVGDVPATHRRGRVHGVGLGEADAGAALDVEQAPELGLLGVIRAGRVAGRRADAAILLAQQLLVGERLRGGVAPQLAPHPLVEMLGGGFRQAIGEGLEHDARVIIVRAREARQVLFDPEAGGDGERAEVVAHPAWPRRHVVRQTLVRLAVGLALLLAQE